MGRLGGGRAGRLELWSLPVGTRCAARVRSDLWSHPSGRHEIRRAGE